MFERPPTPEAKLPVTLVTGFLGSGKTTFINQLLENVLDLRVAVLVNELGQIDIDGAGCFSTATSSLVGSDLKV